MPCICTSCTHLHVWPEMPFMDPPHVADAWANPEAEWSVACHWMGPLIVGRAVLIRRGFTTDGGSIPPAAWALVGHPFQMPCLPYFLAHDAECAAELFRFSVCDARLYKAMAADGHVGLLKRRAIHRACLGYHTVIPSSHTPASITAARSFCRLVGEEEYHALLSSRLYPS